MTMEEIRVQRQNLDDKIAEMQQQVRFCINNYDFYHKNNEFEILNEQTTKLRDAENAYRSFLTQVQQLRKKVAEGHRMCDDVDKLIKDMNLPPIGTQDDESEKENKKHVHFEGLDSDPSFSSSDMD